MLSDVEIAQNISMEPITKVAEKLGLKEEGLELYGRFKAKISSDTIKKLDEKEDGKLILVTAINPTPAGEGKTTTMIGLSQAMNSLGKKTVVAMREPSLGPCFGIKGGAAGGGYAQVVPMDDINLHFTGDLHAITSANNLIAAMLDNAIQQGNLLNIDVRQVVWKRCLDLNDRALRNIIVGLGGKPHGVPREDGFDISVASEIMGALCLATSFNDLKEKISKMIVAYNYEGEPVTVADIRATGAVMILLKEAIKPNLVQTLDHYPVLIHGGPFANIAHGCNSVIATKLALKLGDYAVTEAGFGADLGAEKFFDIKCQTAGLKPDIVIIVATIRALKMHGGVKKDSLKKENIDALKTGFSNLEKHIENMKKFGLPVIVAINHFPDDTEAETKELKKMCKELGVEVAFSTVFSDGGKGGIELANLVINKLEQEESKFEPLYIAEELKIEEKISKVASEIYGAKGVVFSKKARNNLEKVIKMGLEDLPICVAKTQYSISDKAELLGRPKEFELEVTDIIPNAGAGFIVVICGGIMRMPGLPKRPAAIGMDIDENGVITGLA